MQLYSSKDIKIINKNVNNLELKSSIAQLKNIEPTFDERLSIIELILDFIKKRKMIIYGGYAIHLYLDKSIYDIKYKMPDIDIYSNDPINDIIELCNILKEKYPNKNIILKEAFHKDTFSLFVNFINYLDITYIPLKVLQNLKIETKDGFNLIHPSLIILDILRQFNDPLISYWRLDKNIYRYEHLNNKYNFFNYFKNNNKKKNILGLNYLDKKIYKLIKENINFKTMLLTGFYCYHLFTKKKFQNIYYFEIISTNFDKDIKYFNKILSKHMKNIEQFTFYPFFQYINKKTIFYYKKRIILIIYDSNDKCIPFIEYKNEYFVSYLYFIQITFCLYLYYNYISNEIMKELMKKMIFDCILAKNEFFRKNKNINILDKSIFQQFMINCVGETFYTNIEFFKNLKKKNDKYNFKRFNYTPNIDNLIKKKIKFIYENTDGTKIKNF